MKNFFKDTFLVLVALLITGGIVNANSVQPTVAAKQPIKKPHVAQVLPKPVEKLPTAPAPVQPVVAAPVAPQIVYPSNHVSIMQAAGIDSSDYYYVTYILDHESGWCPTKWEGEIGIGCPAYHGYSSAGYGMCQSTPAIKMAVMGDGWETDPVLQLKWCSLHAQGYGGWQAAYEHWIVNHNW